MSKRSMIASAVKAALLASSAASLAFTSQVWAAEEEASDEEKGDKIVITGSRIKREGVDTIYPAISVTSEDLQKSAFTNVADALNQISTFGNPDSTPNGAQNNFGVGQNYVDFLGLGAQRTLTLVDGRRFVSQNSPQIFGQQGGLQVDYNVIPIALVDRIETIGVGGAAIYGSDAIAGTINVILKDDFEGLDFNFQTGISGEGDAQSDLFSIVAGANFSNGRGNVTMSAEHAEQEGLARNDRPRYTRNDPFFGEESDGISRIFENQRINIFTNGGLISPGTRVIPSFGIGASPDGNFYQFDSNSNLVPFTPGAPGPGSAFFALGGDGPDFFDNVAQIQSPLERQVFTSRVNYDLTNDISYSADILFANSFAKELVNQGGFQTFAFGGTSASLVIPADHPLMSQQSRDLLASLGMSQFNIHRFNNDILDSSVVREQFVWRFTQGLEGSFRAADRDFNWDVSFVHGRSDAEGRSAGIIDDRFLNALEVRQLTQADLDALSDPLDLASISGTSINVGDVVCESAYQAALGNITGTSGSGVTDADLPFIQGCVPLNIFGEGAASPEAIAWVTGQNMNQTDIEQTVYNAAFSGELFELPGGMAQFAVGYEKRKEKAAFVSGMGSQVPITRSSPILNTGGEYTTDEYFGEVNLPFLQGSGILGAEMLEVNLSARTIDNDLAGSFTASSYGFRWAPISELQFRANVTESLRAPSLTELFSPQTKSFSSASDPCDFRFVDDNDASPNRAANCASDISGYDPSTFTSDIVNATGTGLTGGNPNLTNETAEAWAWGLSWEPEYIENLLVTFDVVNINLDDAITSLSLTTLMEACYDAPDFPNNSACNAFERDDSGQVVDFVTGQTNAEAIKYRSADLYARYAIDMNDFGRLTIANRMTHTLRRDTSVVGEVADDNIGSFTDPKNSGTLDLTWDKDDLRVFWRILWSEGADLDPTFSNIYEVNGKIVDRTSARIIHNASVSYILPQEFNLGAQESVVQLTVNNVFEREPSYIQEAAGHFGTTELLGRMFNLNLRMSF